MPLYNPFPPPYGQNVTLFRLIGADMNSVADQLFAPMFTFTRYLIDRVIITNASASISTAVGGVYGDVSKGGVQIVAASQTYGGLSTAGKVIYPILSNGGQSLMTDMSLYLSLTIPQGAPATADWYIMGEAG